RVKTLFRALYDVCVQKTPTVDLLVCLSAPTELILERIRVRQREFELKLDPKYYTQLNQLYEEYFEAHAGAKLVVQMDQCDFCKSPELFEALSVRIDRELRA